MRGIDFTLPTLSPPPSDFKQVNRQQLEWRLIFRDLEIRRMDSAGEVRRERRVCLSGHDGRQGNRRARLLRQ
jgi:hypothetical protein